MTSPDPVREFRYRCWSCDRRWADYASKPDRKSPCPFCGASLISFEAGEEKAA